MSIYTLAGGMASALVGAVLGWLGGRFLPGQISNLELLTAIGVALVVTARELGWITIPLPQLRRQTKDVWAKVFPGTLAAALWGLDLGLIFTTYLTFSGVWLLVITTFVVGEPVFGVALFVLHWLGRVLSVWIAPLLVPDASITPQLIDAIGGQYRLFQRIHVMGLVWSVVILILLFTRGTLS